MGHSFAKFDSENIHKIKSLSSRNDCWKKEKQRKYQIRMGLDAIANLLARVVHFMIMSHKMVTILNY